MKRTARSCLKMICADFLVVANFQQHPFQGALPLQLLAFGMLAPQEKGLRVFSFTANLE